MVEIEVRNTTDQDHEQYRFFIFSGGFMDDNGNIWNLRMLIVLNNFNESTYKHCIQLTVVVI